MRSAGVSLSSCLKIAEVPYVVDCAGLEIEMRYKFRFDISPGGDVNLLPITGLIKPVNRIASEGLV